MPWTHNPPTEADRRRKAEYNSRAHKEARRQGEALVNAGRGYCWRCGRLLYPGQWHVGHSDDRTVIRGPECASCNLTVAASKGARVANANRKARRRAQPEAQQPYSSPRW